MRSIGRMAVAGAATVAGVLLGVAVTGGAAGAGPAASYPPIAKTVAAIPPACISAATSIPPVPPGQVSTLEKNVTAFVGHHLQGLGQCGHGLLVLTLTPGSEVLAQHVRTRFGPSVQIMVGLTVWNGRPGQGPTCGALAPPTSTPAGYSATLQLRSHAIRVGGDLVGHVALRDAGTQAIRVLTVNPIEVVLTKPRTRLVVGIYSGAIAGTAYGPLIAPDHAATVGIVGGTARCDGGLGSALPPGHYDAVAEVSGVAVDGTGGEAGGQPPPTFFTPPVPIRIIR
jgi:hypothetical protein